MFIPTEPIGSIPRREVLISAMSKFSRGELTQTEMDAIFESEIKKTIEEFEATGSPVITDGEQSKHSFVSYPLAGLTNLASGGVTIL
ncbi:MAG TPA: 5-methyltetrahydropteroyltriglutamate--homocysteine methyltransferase, partial [Acidobacteriota bacterium]|nr:5-methyltetrahydropteroyltriglutamate--homocysteine methyltransferase [Acidobacteriota bacterium]